MLSVFGAQCSYSQLRPDLRQKCRRLDVTTFLGMRMLNLFGSKTPKFRIGEFYKGLPIRNFGVVLANQSSNHTGNAIFK